MAKVYLDFDSLFDTRIVLLGIISRSVMKRMASSQKYFNRLDDDFWRTDNAVRKEQWKDTWERRGSLVKRNALAITEVAFELRKERLERDGFHALGVTAEKETLVFNSWPYVLADEEKTAIKEMMQDYFRPDEVEFIHVDPRDLPAGFFMPYREAIMYDMNYWLEHNWRSLAERPLHHVRFVAPLYFKGEERPTGALSDIIAKATEQLKPYMAYNPVPSSMFCFMADI